MVATLLLKSLVSLVFLVIPILAQETTIPHEIITDLSQLGYDKNDRLDSHWLLYSNTESCRKVVEEIWNRPAHRFKLREIAPADGQAFVQIFGEEPHNDRCLSACLERGTLKEHMPYVLPTRKHNSTTGLNTFFAKQCQTAEIGFIIHGFEADVVFIDDAGKESVISTMGSGEEHTFWQVSYLGHKFELRDTKNGVTMASITVIYSGVYVIGQYRLEKPRANVENSIRNTLGHEWDRARRVTRTFTDLGFAIGKLPIDLYASMSAYYYNNRDSLTLEEWDSKGLYVNWWESPVYMIGMPWELKRYWQSRLKTLVEEWSGVELELTDIYGMRQYTDGARLLTHVDREETHAASLIVNIAQSQIREPWKIEIYDFGNRLHEVEMNPGDIVYYESARCLHGRMKPLEGGFYVNLFAHYRPKGGDRLWYTRSNPPSTPQQLIDIDTCVAEADRALGVVCENGKKLPYLNRHEELHGSRDLFEYWKKVSPNKTSSRPPFLGEDERPPTVATRANDAGSEL
jgi:hypothetical protein